MDNKKVSFIASCEIFASAAGTLPNDVSVPSRTRRHEDVHVSPVVSALEVVLELGTKHGGQRLVFGKGRPRPVARFVLGGGCGRFTQRGEGEVFGSLKTRSYKGRGARTCRENSPKQDDADVGRTQLYTPCARGNPELVLHDQLITRRV